MGGISTPVLSSSPGASLIFADAVAWIIDVAEGGSQLVHDSGELTKFGISQRAFPDVDIEALTREKAIGLYLESYWRPIKGDSLPPTVALVLFDAAVNQGVVPAVKLLQTSLGIAADGVMGPATIAAANASQSQKELVTRVLELRHHAYEDLVREHPRYTKYLHGWRMRVIRLTLEAGSWFNV
jgi:lysozyme family protein